MKEQEATLESMNQSIQILEHRYNVGELPNESVLASTYIMRGSTYAGNGMFDQSVLDLNKGIKILEQMRGEEKDVDKSTLFKAYIMRGMVRNHMAEYMDEAISDYGEGIKIAKELEKDNKPIDKNDIINVYAGFGKSYEQKENFQESNKYYNKSIEILEQLLNEGKGSQDNIESLSTAYMSRGANHFSLAENDKALSDYNKCIAIREQLQKIGVEQDIFDVFMAYNNRSQSHRANGNLGAAIKDNIIALRALKEAFIEHSELQAVYYNILKETIELAANKNDKTLHNSVIQEFLYSMRTVSKTKEAAAAQDNILDQLN